MNDLPDGIQLLLTAGSRDDAFRECFLEDPLLAARRAGVSLTGSERSILRSVPPAQLAAMIEGLAVSNPERRRFLHTAASAALAIFAGTALAACRSSSQRPFLELPAPVLVASHEQLRVVLTEAKEARLPTMVVVRLTTPPAPATMGGIVTDDIRRVWNSDSVCRHLAPKVLLSTAEAGVRVVEYEVRVRFTENWGAIVKGEFATKHDVTDLPTVLFFDPEGREISRSVQPATDEELIAAIDAAAAAFAEREE